MMKTLSFLSVLVLSAALFGCTKSNPVNRTIDLLPVPQKVEVKPGVSLNPEKIKNIVLYKSAGENAQFTARLLSEKISGLYKHPVKIVNAESYDNLPASSIIMGISDQDEDFKAYASGIPSPPADKEESYVLEVNERSVIISGGDEAGLFYGAQTLIQLLEEASWENEYLTGMTITDFPQMKLRTVHYNYFFHLDKLEYLKESVEKLAKFKVNGIVLEFEDRFKYVSQPRIAAPTSFTAEQVKELTLYAHQYHIDIIPLVQGLGHAGFILKHDEYKHLREDPALVQSCCPLREGTYETLFDMYRETIEATPGVKYFHIGGDEVNIMGRCPECIKKEKEIGRLGLYLTWLNRVHKFMQDNGRTIIYWDDMPLKAAGMYQVTHKEADAKFDSTWAQGTANLEKIIDMFPKDAIFMRWNYELGRFRGNIQTIDWYLKNDFKVTIATAIVGNWPLIPDYKEIPENIRSFVTLGAEKGVFGELCTAWGDDAGNHSEIYWLGFLASVEYAWNSNGSATTDDFWVKYSRRFFGPGMEELIPAFKNLSERVFFWNSALMKRGTKNRRHQLIPLPDPDKQPEKGTWSDLYGPLADSAKKEKIRCDEAVKILQENMDKVAFNKYNLEVFASMGRLMNDHCNLIISLGEIAGYADKAIAARKEGNKEIASNYLVNMAAIAEDSWKNISAGYEDTKIIWEASRYPKGEDGYVMDPQTNYLAGWTADLSYLIFAEKELDLPGYAGNLRKLASQP